jgi:cytochrome b561
LLRNTESAWGTPARLLHWVIALLVLLQIGLGWLAVGWRLSPTKLDLFVWHKSIGFLVLVLMLLRLAWRWANVTPALPAAMTALEQRAAQAGHGLLYLLLLALPLTGWVVSSAANVPLRVFWLLPLPALVAPDKALADAFARVHLGLGIALSLLLLLHITAALRHHLILRDDVLRRMWPGRAR